MLFVCEETPAPAGPLEGQHRPGAGVAQGTVSEDLAAVREAWAEESASRLVEMRDAELAKLRLLEAACWARFAATGNASHARNILKAIETRCKLHSLLDRQAAVQQPAGSLPWDQIAEAIPREELDEVESRIADVATRALTVARTTKEAL